MSTRRALLVGINKFKNYPSAALNGCVNDAKDMALLLKELLGFKDEDITTLTDAQATKANIMKNLKQMVDDAKAGNLNYLVFSLSSHGTQIPDRDADEKTDHADEAFCPYDLAQKGGQWDPDHIISDDELHDLFVQIPQNVLLEVYLDTCHSGTGLKKLDPIELLLPNAPKPRYLPPPSLEEFERVSKLRQHGMAEGRRRGDKLPTSHNILWSGCKADQTSADATFAGRSNGAFTYYYIMIVRESSNKLSRAKVRNKLRSALNKGGFDQIPQLETDATNRNKVAG
jgi:hypothetical protein